MQCEIAEQEAYTSLAYYPLSLIVDSNLSAQELFYFRYLYFENAPATFFCLKEYSIAISGVFMDSAFRAFRTSLFDT